VVEYLNSVVQKLRHTPPPRARVDVYCQLLDSPEKQGSEVAFQMWADPVKAEWNTLVRTTKRS